MKSAGRPRSQNIDEVRLARNSRRGIQRKRPGACARPVDLRMVAGGRFVVLPIVPLVQTTHRLN
jgi:hypothetical protein